MTIGLFVILFTSFWIGCGIKAAFIWFDYFQLRFPVIAERTRAEDYSDARIAFLFGPIALFNLWDHRKFVKENKV